MVKYGTNDELFDIAITAEEMMGKFYVGLMLKFEGEDCSEFFKDMAKDETVHMEKLQRIYDSLSASELAEIANSDILLEARHAMKLKVMEELKSIATVEEAYEAMNRYENSEINAVYSFLMSEFVQAEEKSDFITRQFKEHVNKIDDFQAKYLSD